MGEDTRKRQAEDARATEENSGKAPTTRLQKKDVVPALSGSLLPPLLRQEQPGVMGEDTRKRQAENTIATEENSWKAPTTGLHQKDVVPALSGSPLPPLLRGQQPVVTGEETRKREREDTRSTEENSRKAPLTRVPARSGSLLLPLFLGQQPGVTGEDTRKRQREATGANTENSRKAPRLDQEDVDLSDFNFVKGMPNLGSTCYFNALVQVFLALTKLRTMILRPDARLGLMGEALKDLFVKTSIPGYPGELVDPALLTACVRAFDPTFKGERMHDSQELYLVFLRRLGEEEKEEEPNKHPHTQEGISGAAILDCIFGGWMCVRSSCSCSKFIEKSVPFSNLELALPADRLEEDQIQSNRLEVDQIRTYYFHPPTSIEDCLKQFFEEKKLIWCCSSTSRSRSTSTDGDQTSTEVTIASEELSLAANTTSSSTQLQEFSSGTSCLNMIPVSSNSLKSPSAQDNPNESSGRVKEVKVNDGAVQRSSISKLPNVLTLLVGRYGVCLGGKNGALNSTIKLSGHVSFEEILDVGKFMNPRCEVKNSTYHLAGVIEHIGKTLEEGHYVAYVKANANTDQIRRWFCVGDVHVKEVSLEEVQKCEAYILFYERGDDQGMADGH